MINFFPNQYSLLSIKIGSLNLSIRWYAFFILVGAVCAYFISKREFKKAKYTDIDFYDSLFVYIIWIGTIGCRLWFCAFYNFDYYLANPADIIRVWDGGLAIQGGIVFGVLFAFIYCRANKYSFLKMIDIILPSTLIGQTFGRWGNFINQECHGGVVDASYFDGILSFLKEGMYINGNYYEPLFFYESMLCLIGFILIHFILKRKQNRRGDLGYCYLMWYGVVRFFIEARRTDSLYLGNFKMAQLTSILFVLIGVLGYLGVFVKFTHKTKPTIVFDFDGTLLDTSGSIHEAYRECFKVYSDEAKFNDEIKEEVLGPALKDLFPKYFPGIDYDTVYKTYRTKQIEVSDELNHPTPGAIETLKSLHEQGYKIGILSTRTKQGIIELLEQYQMKDYVDDIVGVKDVENLKPNPEGLLKLVNNNKWNRDVIMIGDSIMDIRCGINYGAYTIAYLDNPNRSQQMAKEANESVSDLTQILQIVKKPISFTFNKI